MPRGQVYATHVVTAGEAAYAVLYGNFTRKYGDGEWGNSIPMRQEPWGITLRHLSVEILRAGDPVLGVPIVLYYLPIPGQPAILGRALQGWTTRAAWEGDLYCEHGFGLRLYLGASVADDVIVVAGQYERGPQYGR